MLLDKVQVIDLFPNSRYQQEKFMSVFSVCRNLLNGVISLEYIMCFWCKPNWGTLVHPASQSTMIPEDKFEMRDRGGCSARATDLAKFHTVNGCLGALFTLYFTTDKPLSLSIVYTHCPLNSCRAVQMEGQNGRWPKLSKSISFINPWVYFTLVLSMEIFAGLSIYIYEKVVLS